MPKKYNETVVMNALAECLEKYFSQASKQLPFSMGYTATVKEKTAVNNYVVIINGVEHSIKTDYPLVAGDRINVMSLQNQKNDLCVIPSFTLIQNCLQRASGN